MTPAQITYKKQLIQKIQMNKKAVFFDDEERKEFIKSRFGVDSITKLTIDELKLLLDFCLKNVSDIPFSKASSAQIKKIYNLWYEKARDKSETALSHFIYKIVKKEKINLTKNDATKIIVALDKLK